MKKLTIIFSITILVAISSCTQQTDVKSNLDGTETRTEIYKTIVGDHELMKEFIKVMKDDKHAMMMIQGDNQMMEMKKRGSAAQYYFSKRIEKISFEQAIVKVIELLKAEGFGILTEIDVKAALKKKLDVDFNNYKILGACNPPYAYKALQAENKIGTMLPCNVVVQELEDGSIEVTAVDPVASMMAIDNPDLGSIASEIQEKLKNVINRL